MQCEQRTFSIFTGDHETMDLKAIYAGSLDPLDLSGCTEIDVALPNADGTFSHRLLSLGQVSITSPAVLGKFTANITSLVSSVLNAGELQSFNVTFTISGNPMTVRYLQALSVFQLD